MTTLTITSGIIVLFAILITSIVYQTLIERLRIDSMCDVDAYLFIYPGAALMGVLTAVHSMWWILAVPAGILAAYDSLKQHKNQPADWHWRGR